MFYVHRKIQADDSGCQRVEIFSTAEKFGEYLQYKLGGDRNATAAVGIVASPDELPPELHQIWLNTHAQIDEGILRFFIFTMPNEKEVYVFEPHSHNSLAAGEDVGWWWQPAKALLGSRHGPYKTKDEAYMQAILANTK